MKPHVLSHEGMTTCLALILPPPLPQTLVAPSHYLRVLSSQHSSSVAETCCLTTFIDEHGHEVNYSVALLAPADPQLVVPLREFRVPSVRDGLDILQEHHARTSITQTRASHQSKMTRAI